VRHPSYAISQWIRKRVEEVFGWMKTVGGLRRTRYKPCAGADACLPRGRRLQPHPNRATRPGSRVKTGGQTTVGGPHSPRVGEQHR
jgi:hypothetical protein